MMAAVPAAGGGPAKIDPVIQGLLARLPKFGDVWPEGERKLWLQLPEGSFKLIYKDKEAPTESAKWKPQPKGRRGWGSGPEALSSDARRCDPFIRRWQFCRDQKSGLEGLCAPLSGEGRQELTNGLRPGPFGALFRRIGAASQSHR
jgi:hypothetical protein